jgi:hypothetical protein
MFQLSEGFVQHYLPRIGVPHTAMCREPPQQWQVGIFFYLPGSRCSWFVRDKKTVKQGLKRDFLGWFS